MRFSVPWLRAAPGTSLRRDLRTMRTGWRWGHRSLVPRSIAPLEVAGREYPTAWARTRLGRAAREGVQRFGLKPLLQIETTPTVFGADVLGRLKPPVIFIANHSSHLDAPLILTSLPAAWRQRTATGAAADYFFDVWWRAAATALAFNAFPVERALGRATGNRGRAARLARTLLEDGWSILMFPEGTRSKDGWAREFRLGAARLAVDNAVPVVPIALRGTYQAMPRGRGWPVPGRPPVHVRFGAPVRPSPGEDPAAFSERMRAGLDQTMREDRTTWWDSLRTAEPIVGGPQAPQWRRVWESTRPMPTRSRAFPPS